MSGAAMSGPSPAALAAAHEFNVEAFTLLAIAVVFVFLRTLQRTLSVGVKKFQLDDYLMLFAIVRPDPPAPSPPRPRPIANPANPLSSRSSTV